MSRCVGIDLGTTYSAVAVVGADGTAEVIHNRAGENITPSVVFFDGADVVVGSEAKNSAKAFPLDVVSFVKRQMGSRSFTFEPEAVQQSFAPEQISAFILRYLIDDASRYLNEPVTAATITVPAYFDDGQRHATRQAGEIAGIDVLGIVNEPTAAALSFGLKSDFQGVVLVYDLGGGTFDVTILRTQGGVFTTLSTTGDRNLGGFDFDNALMKIAEDKFVKAGGPPITDPAEIESLRERCESAKRRLSNTDTVKLSLTYGGHTAKIELHRDEFEKAIHPLLTLTEDLVEEAIEASGLGLDALDKVLLVGGSTRIPAVGRLVCRLTGLEPDGTVHPDEAVALGAALAAEVRQAKTDDRLPILAGSTETVIINDVVSHGLGVKIVDEKTRRMVMSVLIANNSQVPCRASQVYGLAGDDQQEISLVVYEGDEDGGDLRYMRVLGETLMKLREARPKGSPVRVDFACDIDGILHIELYDLVVDEFVGEMEILRTSSLDQNDVAVMRELTRQVVLQ